MTELDTSLWEVIQSDTADALVVAAMSRIAAGSGTFGTRYQAIASNLIPVGTICAYQSLTAPTGWHVCDGSIVGQSDYPVLYGLIGHRFGTASAGYFMLPDLRGWFIRGHANGNLTNDPNALSRKDASGATLGDVVGSRQSPTLASHSHVVSASGTLGSGLASADPYMVKYVTLSTIAGGSGNAVPANRALAYCIRMG